MKEILCVHLLMFNTGFNLNQSNTNSYHIYPYRVSYIQKIIKKKSFLCTGIGSVLSVGRYASLGIEIGIVQKKKGVKTSLV